MSAVAPTESPTTTPSETKGSKKKRKKGPKARINGDVDQSSVNPAEAAPASKLPVLQTKTMNDDSEVEGSPDIGGHAHATISATNGTNHSDKELSEHDDSDARFDLLVKDRDALRAEVIQFRQSLEELQAKHDTSLDAVKQDLQEAQTEKEEAEEQYQNLLGKVNTIKAQLGERLKADAEELAQARSTIIELEDQSTAHVEQQSAQTSKIESMTIELETQSKELSSLRNRSHLSQQNWLKEREELIEQETYTREQFDNAEQAMREWEVLALEERSVRKDLGERVTDLDERLAQIKQAYERAASDRDSQSNTVDGLQKALQEIQSARKKELREVVESSQAETEKLRQQLTEAQKASTTTAEELAAVKADLERVLPFEKEVKEKNLLIGKLRHEAVTLNEHLTKALRFLKKGKPDDNVDRQIITNHLLHFLALERSDPKKFQILQLIAALLGWSDEQREQAGLSRPSATNNTITSAAAGMFSGGGSLRLPSSPLVHRTPSTPALTSSDFFPDAGMTSPGGGANRETLADLWQSFLEQESGAARGGKGKGKEKEIGQGDPGDGRTSAG